MAHIPLTLFSVIAYWRPHPLPFMLTGIVSTFTGFYWFEVYTDWLGLTIGLSLFVYGLVAFGFTFRCIYDFFTKDKQDGS